MEIILKKDVENLGFKDDMMTVKPGYARNFLIPQGLAVLATEGAKKMLAENLRQRQVKEKQAIEGANKNGELLVNAEIVLKGKTADGGMKLFGSVTNHDLVSKLRDMGYDLNSKAVTILGGSVKNLGTYEAKVRLHREVFVTVKFKVEAE
jgi:large subunit ribosomal protein L9